MLLYALVSFLAAFVLFFIQPFMGKVLTPRFGGGAQVWITCMLFFQATLLAGYGYAHWLGRKVRPERQWKVHGLLLGAAGLVMTLGWPRWLEPGAWAAQTGTSPLHLVQLLFTMGALPLVALSASAPLIQAWFTRQAEHARVYRLYAASNAGSLLGLLAFPLATERWLPTSWQARGIALAAVLLALGLLHLGRRAAVSEVPKAAALEDAAPWPAGQAWRCVLASAAGSLLLMAVTNWLTSEVAAIPLLWVLPLLAYLLTFILVFDAHLPGSPLVHVAVWAGLLVVGGLVAVWAIPVQRIPLVISGCCLVVFAGCMVCHGYLYQLRPPAAHLTRYYLLMSTGGVLGGLVVAAAPLLFSRVYEHGFAAALVGGVALLWLKERSDGRLREALPAGAAALACVALGLVGVVRLARQPGQFSRGFFGVLQAVAADRNHLVLRHGATAHGAVDLRDLRRPLAYFHPGTGVGLALKVKMAQKPALKVGVIGLGVGAVSAYARPTDTYVFYEICPEVIDWAGPEGRIFPLLRRAEGRMEAREGDGRLVLEQELRARGSQGFDVLVVDAFSGDAVPWHLLTVEAFRTYLAHLKPDGILVFNVSNPLPVNRVALTTAKSLDLYGAMIFTGYVPDASGRPDPWLRPAIYLLFAPDRESLQAPALREAAMLGFGPKTYRGLTEASSRLPLLSHGRAWRDDWASLSDLLFEPRAVP